MWMTLQYMLRGRPKPALSPLSMASAIPHGLEGHWKTISVPSYHSIGDLSSQSFPDIAVTPSCGACIPDRDDSDQHIGVPTGCCCGENSVFFDGQFEFADGRRSMLIWLTGKHDMTSRDGLDFATSIIHRCRDILMFVWSTIPCTWASAAQRSNKPRRGHTGRMARHKRLFSKLHRNLITLADMVMTGAVDGPIFLNVRT